MDNSLILTEALKLKMQENQIQLKREEGTSSPDLRKWETYTDCWTVNYKEFHNSEMEKVKEEPEDGDDLLAEEKNFNERNEISLRNVRSVKMIEYEREKTNIVAEEELEVEKVGKYEIIVKREEEEVPKQECYHCGEKRSTLHELKEHIYSMHLSIFIDEERAAEKGKKRKEKCTFCQKAFKKAFDMKRHLMTHSGEKPFKCEFCGYRSLLLSNLKTHIRTHSGDKPFKCNVCDYRTERKTNLRTHTLIHSDEKPFKCNLCAYRSSRQADMRAHNLRHSGEKRLKCNLCEYRTSRQGDMRAHHLRHSGEKRFKCDICEYSTSRPGDMRIHHLRHLGEKPFKCTLCEYRTVSKSHLSRHFHMHHL